MNKKRLRVLKEIEASVPQEWRAALITEEYIAPDLRANVIEELAGKDEALANLSGTSREDMEKYFRRLQNIFDSGFYDAKEKTVDQVIAKKIEDHVEAGIQAAIKSGQLSDDDKDLEKYVKKLHRNVKRTQQSDLRTQRSG